MGVWAEHQQHLLKKHGFDFADADRIFDLPLLVDPVERDDYGEDRWISIGLLDGRAIVVVFTEPADNTFASFL